jgi:hypothetical protein
MTRQPARIASNTAACFDRGKKFMPQEWLVGACQGIPRGGFDRFDRGYEFGTHVRFIVGKIQVNKCCQPPIFARLFPWRRHSMTDGRQAADAVLIDAVEVFLGIECGHASGAG